MKKLSIIILVVALAGSMAFGADIAISGDATFSTSFNLDTMTGGSDGDASVLIHDASIVLLAGGAADKTGEGDVYAVLEVSVADWTLVVDEATTTFTGINAVAVDTFKIVVGDEDVVINLLGNSPAGNYAQYFDYNEDDAADIDIAAIGLAGNNGGVDVTAGDITIGVDLWYANGPTTYLVWGAYSSEVADGITIALAAGMDDAAGADVCAQLAYAADGYSVTVGFDSADNFALYEVEADLDAVIDIVTIDANVYYDMTDVLVANQNTIDLGDIDLGLDFYWNDTVSGDYVGADVATTIEGLTVSLAGGLTLDTISADALLDLGYTISDATSVAAYVGYDMATSVSAGASLAQTMDAGAIAVSFDYNADTTIDLAASFTSTTLVDAATVVLGWAADDIVNSLGIVTASVKVAL
ncbi:MAG: hypothetical protein KAQ69_05220 [Spirochaetales bacterium]|nr:hypothetical protein [Spirochaetales bacterium]